MNDHILHDPNPDGIDRRGFSNAWPGPGPVSCGPSTEEYSLPARWEESDGAEMPARAGTLNFVQISDSHIGFNKPANRDVSATFREAIARINALPKAPEFILHTGDLTHLAEAEEFDGLEQMLKDCRTKQVFYVPGEHDILSDNGAAYRARFGKGTLVTGWYSYDQKGVHFIGMVNVRRRTREG